MEGVGKHIVRASLKKTNKEEKKVERETEKSPDIFHYLEVTERKLFKVPL